MRLFEIRREEPERTAVHTVIYRIRIRVFRLALVFWFEVKENDESY
jgi:hypothetical protein